MPGPEGTLPWEKYLRSEAPPPRPELSEAERAAQADEERADDVRSAGGYRRTDQEKWQRRDQRRKRGQRPSA